MIAIPEKLLEELRDHGRESYPEECCGALLGKPGNPPRVRRLERVESAQREHRRRRFLITPEQYRRLEELAAREGLVLLGFYHSHPDHPAVPSEYDREHALPFFHYLVIAVGSGRPGEVTSQVLSEDCRVLAREELITEETRE